MSENNQDQGNKTTEAAPAAPKLADGLFKPFTLGSTLAPGPTGNVMSNMKEPMMDYEKTYQNATKNEKLTPEQLSKIEVKKAKDAKYERCVMDVKHKQGEKKVNPWAVCHASLGKAMEFTDEQVDQLCKEHGDCGDTYEGVELEKAYVGFDKLKEKLEHKKNPPKDAGAVAAAIGRKKYGKKKFQEAAAEGHKMKKSVIEMDDFYDMAENFQKALFNEKADLAPSKKWEPSKEDLLSQLCYKIHDLKHLKDASWLIESEVPGVKSLAEKKFDALKKDITGIARKYKSAPEA